MTGSPQGKKVGEIVGGKYRLVRYQGMLLPLV